MRFLRFMMSVVIVVVAFAHLIFILRGEYQYKEVHGIVACCALVVYSWEDIWR
jgi:hypothetical protein